MKILQSLCGVLILLFHVCIASGQTLNADELNKFLDKADKESFKYTQTFKNLTADETKTRLYYDSDGNLDDRRIIKSTFIVYSSPSGKSIGEFRFVNEYNGKNVARKDRDTTKFFEKLAQTTDPRKEYELLRRESIRYDGMYSEWGMTLNQERPFEPNVRKDFEFHVMGREKVEGRDVWVIEYRQTKLSPYVLSMSQTPPTVTGGREYDMRVFPKEFRPTNPLLRGKIWLDAETAQIWRNEFRLILNPTALTKPLETTEFIYQYQKGDFGILTPKKLQIVTYQVRGKDDQTLLVKKDADLTYEYNNFREFQTSVKESKTTN